MRVPMDRAGKRNTGNNTKDTTVICHDVVSMTTSVTPKVTIFMTTVGSVRAIAVCAPITSLLSRETSAPVRARVKNAIGIFCTWLKTAVRKSKIVLSPSDADCQRDMTSNIASSSATPAISKASLTTTLTLDHETMASTTSPDNIGETTVNTAPSADTTK